jgi:hypothetical protein
MIQTFRARFPELQAIEVAVLDNGKPTDEHGYVHAGTGQIIDAATFLSLYEPTQPAADSGKPTKRAYKRQAAPVAAPARVVKPRTPKPTRAAAVPKPERPSVSAAVRAALADGPKDLAAIIEYVQTHGFNGVEDRNISNIVYQLRRAGQLLHNDNGTYALALGARNA